jgi:hypothetical protein
VGIKPIVVIMSRNRSTIGMTWKWAPKDTLIALHRSEEQTYRDAGIENEFWLHDETNSVAVRNFLLDKAGKGAHLITLDDDIKKIGRFIVNGTNGKVMTVSMNGADWLGIIKSNFDRAVKNKYHLFGVAPTRNPLAYNPKKPISTNVFIGGPCSCLVVTNVRYDTNCKVKCDYELAAQHVTKGLGVFRLNYFWYDADFGTLPGGRTDYRREEDAKESFNYLLNKYPDIFRPNYKRKYEIIMK